MALVIPSGFAHCSVQISNSGDPDPWYVTWGVAVVEDPDVAKIGYRQAHSLEETFGAEMPTSCRITGCNVKLGTGVDTDPITQFVSYPGTVSAGGPKLPQNCALLVDKYTESGGKANRGRFFLPGVVNEAGCSDVGVIDGADVLNFQTLASALLVRLNDLAPSDPQDGDFTPMVILHNADSPETVPTLVTRLSVQNRISTQRRRLR